MWKNSIVSLAKLAMLKHGGLQGTAMVKCGCRIAMLFSLKGVFIIFRYLLSYFLVNAIQYKILANVSSRHNLFNVQVWDSKWKC